MNISVNGQCQVPPGFRFHPTEEELLHYYLRKKVAHEKIDLDVIPEVDLNKLEPWEIQETCKIGSTPQNDWYFFSHKDKKYPTGTRTNRATAAGFWKATGRDKIIYSGCTRIGLRKTLVFYMGRAPQGQKSDWIMHEYKLDDQNADTLGSDDRLPGEFGNSTEDGWAVCRMFRKKNYLRSNLSSSTESEKQKVCFHLGNDQTIINKTGLLGAGTSEDLLFHERVMHLPRLESSPYDDQQVDSMLSATGTSNSSCRVNSSVQDTRINDWVTLDRLVASQLNCTDQVEIKNHQHSSLFTCQDSTSLEDDKQSWYPLDSDTSLYGTTEDELWSSIYSSSAPSSSDPLWHFSV